MTLKNAVCKQDRCFKIVANTRSERPEADYKPRTGARRTNASRLVDRTGRIQVM